MRDGHIMMANKEFELKAWYMILTCIFRASHENSISRPKALYLSDHRDRSGLSSNTYVFQINNYMDQTPVYFKYN